MHHQRIISASTVHHQSIITASSVHHQCIISTSSAHHQCILSALSVYNQCITSASSVHHQHITSASSPHHQFIISASSVYHQCIISASYAHHQCIISASLLCVHCWVEPSLLLSSFDFIPLKVFLSSIWKGIVSFADLAQRCFFPNYPVNSKNVSNKSLFMYFWIELKKFQSRLKTKNSGNIWKQISQNISCREMRFSPRSSNKLYLLQKNF